MPFWNGVSRFLVCPAVVWAADALMPRMVQYANFWQILVVGWVLAAAGIAMDLIVLPELASFMGAAALDAIVAGAIVYFSQFVLAGTGITLAGAGVTGLLLGISELGFHAWIAAAKPGRQV